MVALIIKIIVKVIKFSDIHNLYVTTPLNYIYLLFRLFEDNRQKERFGQVTTRRICQSRKGKVKEMIFQLANCAYSWVQNATFLKTIYH